MDRYMKRFSYQLRPSDTVDATYAGLLPASCLANEDLDEHFAEIKLLQK